MSTAFTADARGCARNRESANTRLHITWPDDQVELLKSLLVRRSDGFCISAYDNLGLDSPAGQNLADMLPARPMEPSRQSAAHLYTTQSTGNVPGTGLESMEDFEKANPYDPNPPQRLVPINKQSHHPEFVTDFHNVSQLYAVKVDFDFKETSKGVFVASARFGPHLITAPGTFANKKFAKEAVSKHAMPTLQAMISTMDLVTATKKRKISELATPADTLEALNAENWVGLLQNYAQAKKHPLPIYTEMRTEKTPHRFACTLRIEEGPLRLFGSDTTTFAAKGEAKRSAAREAVLWLRSQDLMAPAGSSTKRPKTTPSPEDANNVDPNATIGQKIQTMVAALGFSCPVWEVEACGPGAYVNMAATFAARDVQVEPRLSGRVARVENIFGKKKAKEACGWELLRVLEGIRDSRITEMKGAEAPASRELESTVAA